MKDDVLKNPKALRAANMAELLLKPHSIEAKTVVRMLSELTINEQFEIGDRTRRMKQGPLDRFNATVAALLGDLLFAQLHAEAEGFCWRRSDKDLFKYTMAESRPYETLKKLWTHMGYIEVVTGFRGQDDWMGMPYYPDSPSTKWATRLRATSKLIDFLSDHGITPQNANKHFKRDQKKSVPVVLKATKKEEKKEKVLHLPDSTRLREIESEVIEINAFLEEQSFSFGPAPYLYRSFNNGDDPIFNWNHGGRFYTHGNTYLNGPKEDRKDILINGSEVVELDVTACQLTILHGLVGYDIDTSKDPYVIEGIPRDQVKKIVNVWIGLGGIPELDKLSDPQTALERNKATVLEHLPVLHMLSSHGLNSVRLQAVDSDIMAATLLMLFRDHSIPALPVHDCIIVRREDEKKAREVFAYNFERIARVRPRITQG